MKKTLLLACTLILALTACGQPAPTDAPKVVDPTIATGLPRVDPLAVMTTERDQYKAAATELQKQAQFLQVSNERSELAVKFLQLQAQANELVKQMNEMQARLEAANKRIAEMEAVAKEKK